MLEPNFPSVEPRGPHLQLISGWWFSGCSVWWGSAALDHHSIQLCVYLSFSNKSLPVPVCLAPQTHNLLPRSALLASPLLLPRCDPPSVHCAVRTLFFSCNWQSRVSRTDEENQQGQINWAQAGEWPQLQELVFSLPSGPEHMPTRKTHFYFWLTEASSIWLTNDFFIHDTP